MTTFQSQNRSTTELQLGLGVALAVLWLLALWVRADAFLSNSLLTAAGAVLSVFLVVVAYDLYHRRRRLKLWRPLRLVVDRAVAHQVSLLVQTLLWQLTDSYLSYGSQIDQCAIDPTPTAVRSLGERIEKVVAHLNKFGGSYNARVPLTPEDETGQSGETLAKIYCGVLGRGQLAGLRDLLTPLAPFAEECAEVILAAEDLVATAWVTEHSAIAALASELRDADFMAGFPQVVLKMKALYSAVGRDFDRAIISAA